MLYVIGCNSEKNYCYSKFIDSVIVDSNNQTSNRLNYDPNERTAAYPVYYIGEQKDTIKLPEFPLRAYANYDYIERDSFDYITQQSDMEIFVDTCIKVTHLLKNYSYFDTEGKQTLLSMEPINCYAIIANNKSTSNLHLGIFNFFCSLVRQAKNEKGEWIDIENETHFSCGTGAKNVVLKPNNIIIAKLLRFKGEFKTECRLKYKREEIEIYSNIFTDYIDRAQILDSLKKNHY